MERMTTNSYKMQRATIRAPIILRKSELNPLRVKLLSSKATMPQRASAQSAGFDLSSAETITLPAKGVALVNTDLSIECPEETYGRIAPRSSLSMKMIDCGAGVVDADYRGNVGVLLFNHGSSDFEIKVGDRIAQLILERVSMTTAVHAEELSNTTRGEGGFGSTGINDGLK